MLNCLICSASFWRTQQRNVALKRLGRCFLGSMATPKVFIEMSCQLHVSYLTQTCVWKYTEKIMSSLRVENRLSTEHEFLLAPYSNPIFSSTWRSLAKLLLTLWSVSPLAASQSHRNSGFHRGGIFLTSVDGGILQVKLRHLRIPKMNLSEVVKLKWIHPKKYPAIYWG